MAYSRGEQFAQIVHSLESNHHAHLCEGDKTTAITWNDSTEITVRLSLRGDEIWILAGSGLLVRFVTPSDGQFDQETIVPVVDEILAGGALEFFGAVPEGENARVATGFTLGSGAASSGETEHTADFTAQLAGPFARSNI